MYVKHLETGIPTFIRRRPKIKLNVLKKHLQYLGHSTSETVNEHLLEKLSSLQDMPPPRNLKQVKQFLVLVSYNRKFVPQYAHISRPLTSLTKTDITFDVQRHVMMPTIY